MTDKSHDADVTLWIESLQEGDEAMAGELWQYCFPRLLRYSRKKLPTNLRKALDEEDVALSAFKSLLNNVKRGGAKGVSNRDELWKLLTCIAARKVSGYVRHETRKKRGGGLVRGESIFIAEDETGPGIQQIPGTCPSPAALAQFGEQCCELLEMLDDDTLRTIAILRMEGYIVEEIATRLKCSKRSVERRLTLIRRIWQESDQVDSSPS